MSDIHSLAVVSPKARIGQDVRIGPFTIIEDGVEIGDQCELAAHVVVKTGTILGQKNFVAEGAVLGGRPQHLAATDEVGRLIIGDENVIRENVTVHRGLKPDCDTRIGNHCFLMVNAHVAHDCQLGDHLILANNSMLAGHVEAADRAYLSAAAGIHQFCRIGALAMVGGQSRVVKDVPPFVTVDGKTSLVVGLNLVGLRRAGMTTDEIRQLKAAYRLIYRSGLKWTETLEALADEFTSGPAAQFHPFLVASKRGVIQERRTPRRATVSLPTVTAASDENHQVRKAG